MAMLSATASVTQLAEHRTIFARSRVRFPAGWPNVAFFATGPGRALKISRHSRFSSFTNYQLNSWRSSVNAIMFYQIDGQTDWHRKTGEHRQKDRTDILTQANKQLRQTDRRTGRKTLTLIMSVWVTGMASSNYIIQWTFPQPPVKVKVKCFLDNPIS